MIASSDFDSAVSNRFITFGAQRVPDSNLELFIGKGVENCSFTDFSRILEGWFEIKIHR